MTNPTAFVLYEPYGPRDWQIVTDENTAYTLVERLTLAGTHAKALIGEHSADELLAAIRKERSAHVARLAAKVADSAAGAA